MSSFNQTFQLDEAEELRIFLSEGEEISIMVRRKILIDILFSFIMIILFIYHYKMKNINLS